VPIESWFRGPVPTYRVNKHKDRKEGGRGEGKRLEEIKDGTERFGKQLIPASLLAWALALVQPFQLQGVCWCT
jgi:hypothetical protein